MKLSRCVHRYALAVALLTAVTGALAEHEANHRYILRGYVQDTDESPLGGVAVSVRVAGERVGSTKTGPNGYYSLQVHLHDDHLGDSIEVRAGAHSGEVRMRGERGNRSSARIHFVSFVGERLVESDLGKFRIPTWAYIVGFLAALTALVMFAERQRRRRRRALRVAAATASAAAVKPKKRKRKQRKSR